MSDNRLLKKSMTTIPGLAVVILTTSRSFEKIQKSISYKVLIMSIKVVADLRTLFKLAHELALAEKSGDNERIQQAKQKHDDYKECVLMADTVSTGMTYGHLYDAMTANRENKDC